MAGIGGVGLGVPGAPTPPFVPAAAPGNPVLPPAPLPAFLVPSPAHGEICRSITARHGGDINRFLALMDTEMRNMATHLADPSGAGLLTHALGVQTGPCSFLAIIPPTFTGHTQVEVIHGI
jgi:hypothetical protein